MDYGIQNSFIRKNVSEKNENGHAATGSAMQRQCFVRARPKVSSRELTCSDRFGHVATVQP